MNGRTIVIGDIHGCHEEFVELLRRVEWQSSDHLILLGDLVNRGPASGPVVQLARKLGAVALLGNHERRLLAAHRELAPLSLRASEQATYAQLQPDDWRYLETMPLTHECAERGIVFVHGGFVPNLPWREQGPEIVTEVQVVTPDGQPHKRRDFPEAPSWADTWMGPPFVIYGHTPRETVYERPWSLGLDTACAMGGHLTACILPERRIVQVKAKQRYYP